MDDLSNSMTLESRKKRRMNRQIMKESDRVLFVEDQSEDPASAHQSARTLTNLTENTPISTSPIPSSNPGQHIEEVVEPEIINDEIINHEPEVTQPPAVLAQP